MSPRQALEAGNEHVVVDKPFTLDADQARSELAALAQRQGKISLAVYQNRRFDADFLTVRDVIASGRLGRLVYFESHFDKLGFRPHVRRTLAGTGKCPARRDVWVDLQERTWSIRRCNCSVAPTPCNSTPAVLRDNARVNDHFHAVLRYESGPHAPLRVMLHATTLAAIAAPRYILHGTRGSYVKYGVDVQEDALKADGRSRRTKAGASTRCPANFRWWPSTTGYKPVPGRTALATMSTTTRRCATRSWASRAQSGATRTARWRSWSCWTSAPAARGKAAALAP